MNYSPQATRRNPNPRTFSPTRGELNPSAFGRRDPSPNMRPKRQANFELESTDTSRPLLPSNDVETINTSSPPLAGPETDNESDSRETINGNQPGVDDGFFPADAENIPPTTTTTTR